MITDFCGYFDYDFLLAYHWIGLKLFRHPVIEFFAKGVGFSRRAYKDLSNEFTYTDSAMGPFMLTVRITTSLTAFDEREIMYLAATNAGWLPSLANKGICYVHYSTNRVRRQFGLD